MCSSAGRQDGGTGEREWHFEGLCILGCKVVGCVQCGEMC